MMIFRTIVARSVFAFPHLVKSRSKLACRCLSDHGPHRNSDSVKKAKEHKEDLSRQLAARIRMMGPIPVAEYMREALTHPTLGYYTTRSEVFGKTGDFVTSPEISQLFGEMVGVWCLNEWRKVGSPKPVQIVELGPGTGSLAEDILKVWCHLEGNDVTLRLVEISQSLIKRQAQRLCGENVALEKIPPEGLKTSRGDVPVQWYSAVDDVPVDSFTIFLAHEFLDALPIHKFQFTEDGWREVLVDTTKDSSPETPKFRFVISRNETPASKIFLKNGIVGRQPGVVREVSPAALALGYQLATRIEEDGGFVLIADYGHLGEKGDTLRAFSNHKLHDPLENPGKADLTADVDFRRLQDEVGEKALTIGPVPQQLFLQNMGIDIRLEALKKSCSSEKEVKWIEAGYRMLTDPTQMGERFKFFALFPCVLREFLHKFPVAGFPPQRM
ncbi:protein arginine methyltransferase NDUFAF7 homolog, mitochondrial [Ischnura elegans]|uniref:protein arginine methyltransferase NDUFAF7 homolog, mitochondrial n=1 Tax=Ischnura elegans TaxID=197161 RepID=UPI001ED8766E|nr:protein arginine methyltransferase NDUFAF7 homolog, mitochondrial [Ischnura elegans]